MNVLKQRIGQTIGAMSDQLKEIAAYINANPELGHEEVLASARLIDALENIGYQVQRNPLGLSTAFIAEYRSDKPGPTVALFAEYDALPEIGHACGHHLICTMALGAAAGLCSVLDETGGIVRVYGTPAEETMGAKVDMAAAGLFDDCDIALMAHPYHAYEQSGTSMALDAFQFEFHGKSAHAAANPEQGINALDAVILLFNAVNALRQQTPEHARIHGVITHGGLAPNVIPDYAVAKFYVRGANRAETDELSRRVNACAEAAALATGCGITVSNYEYSYDELRTNETLSAIFTANLVASGIPREEIHTGSDHGSLDLGNVSLRCPAIHPYIQVTDQPYSLHTIEFRDAARSDQAYEAMVFGATVLAYTAFDVLTNPELAQRIREEFERTMQA